MGLGSDLNFRELIIPKNNLFNVPFNKIKDSSTANYFCQNHFPIMTAQLDTSKRVQ
jgi:hypothetical protein